MSTFSIPNNQKQIRQLSRYDTAGEIVESYNLNLSKKLGKMNSSQKLEKITSYSSFTIPILDTYYPYLYLITTSATPTYRCLGTADPTNAANWTAVSAMNGANVGSYSDSEKFSGKLLLSSATDIGSWDGTTFTATYWTSTLSGTALTDLYPHILHTHRGGQETLFVTDKNLVRYYNSTAGHSTVTLQTDLVACCVTSGVSATWVGTYNTSVDNAYVYEIYVGEQISSVPVARNAYKIDGKAVLTAETIDNVPYIFTDTGNLQAFNGAGFETVASLPFAGSDIILSGVIPIQMQSMNRSRPVHPKGMKRHNRSLYISINTKTSDNVTPENTPSGIWEYDIDTKQLTHRFSFADASTDAGATIMGESGHLLLVNNAYTTVLSVASSNETGVTGLYGNTSSTPQSHFVTKEIESQTIQDAYKDVFQKAKTMAAGESIELKFRTVKRDKISAQFTYAHGNEIITTATVTGVEVGDEVTDTATGLIAHITAVDTTVTTTTLTLDTSIGTEGNTHLFDITNFKPIGYDERENVYSTANKDTYTSADGELKTIGGFEVHPWIQFKVVFYGNIEYRQFTASGKSKNET